MNDISKKVIVYALVWVVVMASGITLAQGTAVSITISGNNASVANTNKTCYGCNNSINVVAWNTSYTKTWMVNSRNNSLDTLSFNISNVTAHQVQQLTVNGTVVNAYQAGANGMLNFTYVTNESNKTYTLAPAQKMNGVNMTWLWLNGISVSGVSGFTIQSQLNGTPFVGDTVYQNTNTTAIMINLRVNAASGTLQVVKSDTSNPPALIVSKGISGSSSWEYSIMFLVLPNHYWMFTPAGSSTANQTIWR